MSYIGVDIGTSGCKASVLEKNGSILATANRDYSFISPRPGWAELDPTLIWQAVVGVLTDLAPAAGDVTSIAVSSIGESMVMTDAQDNVLHNAITYVDSRSESTVSKIGAIFPDRKIHAITGMPPNQMYSLNKLLWMRENERQVLEKTRKIFLFSEYIGYMLTGERLIDPSSAARTMLMDARTLQWSDVIMQSFQIDKGLFAPIAQPGTLLGNLLAQRAKETGLRADIEVILGCHDQPCSTLGSGTLSAGDAMITQGSSESLNLVIEKENITEALLENKIAIEPYFDGKYFITAAQLTHGTSIRWFVDMFREKLESLRINPDEDIFAAADRLCADSSASTYFLPYMSGVDPNEADNDVRGCFIGLDVTMNPWQMYRAVLEGLSFETRMRLERLMQGGVPLRTIIAAGGAAKSDFFMQMKADVLEQPLKVLQSEEAGIKGLGMICAVARNDYSSYAEAVESFVQIKSEFLPKTSYTHRYREYKIIHEHMRAMYRDLR